MTMRRNDNVLTYNCSFPTVTITRQPCQKCPQCHHTESVTLSTPDGQSMTVLPPFAAAFWDVAELQARRSLL